MLNSFFVILVLVLSTTYSIGVSFPALAFGWKCLIALGVMVFLMICSLTNEVIHVLVVLAVIALLVFGYFFPGMPHLTAITVVAPLVLGSALFSIVSANRDAKTLVQNPQPSSQTAAEPAAVGDSTDSVRTEG